MKPIVTKLVAAGLLVFGGFFLLLLLLQSSGALAVAGNFRDGTPSFFPVIIKAEPTPTATTYPAEPKFVKTIALPGAECPNYVYVNEVTDYVYIANNFSENISFLRGTTFLGNVLSGGEWPTRITMNPANGLTYITNLHGLNVGEPSMLAEFNGMSLVHSYKEKFEGYSPLYNPVNQYLYVTDLDSTIRVFNASTSPVTFLKDIGPADGLQGWIKAITFDPTSGLVFATSWDYGKLYVIEGLNVKAVKDTQAWGPDDVLFDPAHGYIYVAGQEVNNRPQGYPANNVTVFNAKAPYQFLGGFATSESSHRLAFDPISGLVYAANPLNDSVTVLNGLQPVGTVQAGDFPYAIAVNPNTGYVFVANTYDNTISILKDAAFVTSIPSQGIRPFAIDVDTRNNTVYVANRGTEGHLACSNNASVTILR